MYVMYETVSEASIREATMLGEGGIVGPSRGGRGGVTAVTAAPWMCMWVVTFNLGLRALYRFP